jgi:hypothetical protein
MDKPERPPSSSAPPDEPSALAGPEVGTVVEANEARTERIAFMRHELAELQRQLIEAQRRVATELEGRAEDADRIEELEARLHDQEVKAREEAARIAELTDEISGLRVRLESASRTAEQLRRELDSSKARVEESERKHGELAQELEEQVSSLRDTKTLLAARDEEVATTLAERDAERTARARLEGELQAALAKQDALGEELESSNASLTAVKKLLSGSEAELAAMTSERDAQQETRLQVEDDLDRTRRTLEAGRARVQQLAEQIFKLGQAMVDAAVTGEPRGVAPEPSPVVAPATPPPPPIPQAKPEVALESVRTPAPSRARNLLLVLGGIGVGVAASLGVVKLRGSSAPATTPSPVANEPVAARQLAYPVGEEPPTASVDRTGAQPADAGISGATPSAGAERVGIIVLPPEADGHRVYVDDRQVQPKNGRIEVACGPHTVKIGSRSEARPLEVACGGETVLAGQDRRP